ncbi:uncharacterized protein LOC111055814 isoform X2 [Nilaparvata lugens]|uniref:uncharacterized protein LOC111055814 isoform X1 n=1 Tax=Nilaparvata lugens TaxID=108931 RepID=UPI00193E1865|nr:uncharacterized protein LOC111055814 isoform X1 [Nilaparvata lugens]XP_039278592.1 uncharacterized protein LOC111055814 isoform X1 [Nilaparvata lugens]XP_039278593.1 uncharacterized protein LOC111055814 isoform X1 [Nilaparvata lugens]XP_039278595.1 uncharacterized protein LOC111055814 isoform X1 [Nilaparvata lugens]XP_039278596.1 uncharacterized protein LOC111055814 isoform X2 [Nilaparvata lugens]
MNPRQLCLSVTSVLFLVILVFPSVLTADDTSFSNHEYQEDNDEDDDDDDAPPENVDFEPYAGGADEITHDRLTPGGAADGRCPPPARGVASTAHELCSRRTCTHDANCTHSARDNGTHLVCCFNGCVRACVLPMDAPVAFDWIEKPTQLQQSIAPSETVHLGAAESMALPGGCIVSTTQYNKLETFKMNQHVSHCFCDIGGIFCKIAES